MRKNLLTLCIFSLTFLLVHTGYGQALPNLKSASGFALFSSIGAVTNVGNSQVTGNVGSNTGTATGFGNIDGQMHNGDATSQQCANNLNDAVAEINALPCDNNLLTLAASNQSFTHGVYCITLGATLSGDITIDAQHDPNAVFIFNITGALTVSPGTRIILANDAQACRVFWQVGGLVTIGSGSMFKGNIIGSGPGLNAIVINTGAAVEGRAFATIGAIALSAAEIRVPVGCGLLTPTGPTTPNLRTANCYALFSSAGNLTNSGTTTVTGRIGTNNGTVTGYQASNISQGIFINDANTLQCKTDIDAAYTYISGLPVDIDLAFPAAFGNSLILTPHVYRLNTNTVLTDTLFLDALGNSNSVFVIRVIGNFATSSNAVVRLLNGAKSCNVFWQVTGTVILNANTSFAGSLISDNTIDLNAGDGYDGRMLTRSGNITSNALQAAIPTGCGGCPFSTVNNPPHAENDSISILEDAAFITIAVQNNDSDPDGDPLTTSILVNAKHGTATLNGNAINYTSNHNFNGRDTVTYVVCDNKSPALCDTAFLFINVVPVNDTPVAVNDAATTLRNVPVTIHVTANDSDPDGDALTVSITTPPAHGTVLVTGNNVVYTPSPGFTGSDTLYYQVCDNGSPVLCDTAMVVIQVLLNRPPVAANDSIAICENSITILLTVQDNDADPDGDSLATGILTGPAHGTASLNGKAISYTVNNGYTGNDTITYTICDNGTTSLCDTASVFIKVNAKPAANAGPDKEIPFGESVSIGSNPVAGTDYSWTPSAGLSSISVANPVASPVQTTTYTLTVVSTATGCNNTDDVIVQVSGDGFYNGFSPNGDGKNDFWKIPALNNYPNNTVTILNRFGDEVWRGDHYDNNTVKFTGQNMNGNDLPDGTYFYAVQYNNLEKQGWVIIKR